MPNREKFKKEFVTFSLAPIKMGAKVNKTQMSINLPKATNFGISQHVHKRMVNKVAITLYPIP